MRVTPAGMMISCNEVHPTNAQYPIEVTLSGMIIVCSCVQSEKAAEPIYERVCGRIASVIVVQYAKAPFKAVTLSGTVTLVTELRAKAPTAIPRVPASIVYSAGNSSLVSISHPSIYKAPFFQLEASLE